MGAAVDSKLAVLIDADNAQPSVIAELLAEVSRPAQLRLPKIR